MPKAVADVTRLNRMVLKTWLCEADNCRIGESRRVKVPIFRVVVQIALNSLFERSVKPFDLSICLRMIRRGKLVLNVQELANGLEKLSSKARPVV